MNRFLLSLACLIWFGSMLGALGYIFYKLLAGGF